MSSSGLFLPRYWKGLGREVDTLGFGCWQLGGNYAVNGKPHGWGTMEEKEAVRLVHAALDQGIQFFDTAAGYGNGRSEERLGKGLRSSMCGDQAVVCTKTALEPDEVDLLTLGKPFKQRVEASLARLGTPRIDVLLLHGPPDTFPWEQLDTWALDHLVREGKVGTYGISAISLAGAHNAVQAEFGTCVEWVFHFLERRPSIVVFPKLEQAGMNFIARSPLSRGLLSERYRQNEPRFASDEFRATLPDDWVKWTVEAMRPINSPDNDISHTAIRFCLSQEAVSVVIPGIRQMQQLESLGKVRSAGPLNRNERSALTQKLPMHYPPWT